MKIFEVTKLKEAVDPAVLAKVRAAIEVYRNIRDNAGEEPEAQQTEPAADNTGSENRSADDLLNDIEERIIAGDADLNQTIDAELAKSDATADSAYSAIYNAATNAARSAAQQIMSQVEIEASERSDFISEAEMFILLASFVYIDVKYNNGNPNASQVDDARATVRQALENRQQTGGGQQAGGEELPSAREVWNRIKARRDELPRGPERTRLSNLMNQINVNSTTPEEAAEILAQANQGGEQQGTDSETDAFSDALAANVQQQIASRGDRRANRDRDF